jgi:hypothetical protein
LSDPIRPIPTPWRQRIADFRYTGLQATVTIVAVLSVVALMAVRANRMEYVPFTTPVSSEVAASSAPVVPPEPADLQPLESSTKAIPSTYLAHVDPVLSHPMCEVSAIWRNGDLGPFLLGLPRSEPICSPQRRFSGLATFP